MAVYNAFGAPRFHQPQRFGTRRDDQITANQRVTLTCCDADRVDIAWPLADPAVDMHSTTLLGQPRHLHHASPFAVDMRGHRQHSADCDDARTANTGNHHVVGPVDRRQYRVRHVGQINIRRRLFADFRAFDRHKRRAEPFDTREILVARRLVNRTFTAQFRLDRHDGHTVGLHPAIAAAFTDIGIDKDPLVRIRKLPAFATASFLGSAGLHINYSRHTLVFAKLLLHQWHLRPLMHIQSLGKACKVDIFFLIIDKGHIPHSHRLNFATNLIGGQPAIIALTAGHGHRIIIEDFVGDIGFRHQRKPNGLNAGVVIGTVAQVLEHMVAGRERRLADPVRALAPHLGKTNGFAVHPLHHVVTADARIGARPFGDFG